MSTIALPSSFTPSRCSLRLAAVQRVFSSPFGGAEQVVDLLNDRWLMTVTLSARSGFDVGAEREAFLAAMRGQSNTVQLWHFARPVVRGTLASATCGAAAQGADSVTLTGTGTLKAGDMLGISGLLLQVAANVTLSGPGAVTLVNRLRTAITGGSVVTFIKPTAQFRLASPNVGVSYSPRVTEELTMDFMEYVA